MPASRRVLTLLMLAALAVCLGRCLTLRLRRLGGRLLAIARSLRRREANRLPLSGARRELLGSPFLVEIAFDYERAVLELDDVDEETKNRAIFLVSRVIVPLLGHVRLADLTPRLEEGTAEVLATQFPPDPQGAVYVFRDLVRWGRMNFLRPTRSLDDFRGLPPSREHG